MCISADLEYCHQQADVPKLFQDENVCDPGCHSHVVRSFSQSLQPPVSTKLNTNAENEQLNLWVSRYGRCICYLGMSYDVIF